MIKIRLARSGAKKRPFYPIVVADGRASRDGRHIEKLGFFNPIAVGQEVRLQLDLERVDYWINRGAQPSVRIRTLIKEAKLGPEVVAQKRAANAEKVRAKKQAMQAAKKEAESAKSDDS